MRMYYLTFRSVTYAQRGEKLLNRNGYRCTIQRTPRWMEEQGCGYALRVWTQDIGSALKLLQENQLQIKRIYKQGDDGQLKERRL